jgi:hypothetical protein
MFLFVFETSSLRELQNQLYLSRTHGETPKC